MVPISAICLLAPLLFLGRLCFCREIHGESGDGAVGDLNLNPSLAGVRGSAMVLPLVLSASNFSKVFAHHRKMQGSNTRGTLNAHMKLYDDLLLHGYYTTKLWIGTPPQEFALIVDSGSTVTYVPCSTCKQCGVHQDPRFQPDESSTYQPKKCNGDCTCDSEGAQCVYERHYAEMSSSSGVLGQDVVSFGNESSLTPQRVTFGCENAETGDLYSQRADGIMGLGRGTFSIIDQLVEKGVISDSFSLCYGGMDVGGGAMVLGGIPPPNGMVFSPSDSGRSPYYNIELKEIHVAGEKLQLNPRIFNGKHGTVLDSGTTYAYLPETAFTSFRDAIFKSLQSLKRIPGPDPTYHDICFSGAGSNVSQLSETFPSVDLVFSNSQKLSLSPENYLFKHAKVHGAYCLGIFQNGRDPTTLLGGIVVRNTLVTYDRGNEKIGFWKTNCSELWDRLQPNRSAPPSLPPSLPLPANNSITPGSPTTAPAAAPVTSTSGNIQRVGFIEVVLQLATKIPDLIPRLPELRESIAREVEVELYQVRIINFTSEGNSSIVAFAIYPASSTDFLSNNTVELMHSRFGEHNISLLSPFGNSELLSWRLRPSERTWLREHLLVIIAMPMIAGLLITSALIGWHVWKRWRSQAALGAYKPVDAVIPEQELQPL